MKIFRVFFVSLATCSAAFAAASTPQASPAPQASATPAAPAKTKTVSHIDPQALAILKRMSNTLAGAKSFVCKTQGVLEVPSMTGQFVTFFTTGEISMKRPNKFAARIGGDAPHFDFYYDGSSVTAYAPGTGVYSTKKAPPTLDAMLPGLKAETGMRFPVAPLLYSNPYAVLTRGVFSGVVIGRSTVNGVACEHLAFRSPGVNWEIWIEAGTRAVPRRLATTFTDRPNFPRMIITFSDWSLDPWMMNDGIFTFHKPTSAREIPFASVMKFS